MPQDNTDLVVSLSETFDSWRGKYNQLTLRTEPIQKIGEIAGLDPTIPVSYRDNLVEALNYVYQIRISDGQPLTNSTFTDCLVPTGSSLFFNYADGGFIRATSGEYGYGISIGYGLSTNVLFTQTGSVGILTSNPESTFHCNGTAQVTELLVKNPVTQRGPSIRNTDLSGVNYSIFDFDSSVIFNNSNSNMIINRGGGKVGIGYQDATTLLDTLSVKSSTTSAGFKLENSNSNSAALRYENSGLTTYVNETQRMRITDAGQVGINRDVPSYTLDVNGTVFGSSIAFGTTLSAGSAEVISVSGAGQTTFSLTSAGVLKHGTTTIIDSDGKISWSSIKSSSITTDIVSEGVTNKYFTDARAVTAVSSLTLTGLSVQGTGSISHGGTVIVGTDSKIDWTRIKNFSATSDGITEGATNKYFTDARAVTAVSAAPGITLSGILGLSNYPTSSRPTGASKGSVVYDSTLNLPIFFDGTSWKKFDGTAA